MKHCWKSRIRWIARVLRWLDRRKETAPGITPWEASLYRADEEYRLRRETVRTR